MSSSKRRQRLQFRPILVDRLRLVKSIGRRDFVRTTGGIVIAAAVGNACREVGAPGSGIVRVTITGLPSGLSSAGSARITSAGIDPITIQLPGAATGEQSVAVGTYHVVYTPPAGFTIAPGTSNEADVTIQENQATEVTFVVVAATATLRLTVTGLGAGVSSGGSASLLRTDLGGQSPLAVVVPPSGIVDSTVAAGTYAVTYTPPGGHAIVPGGSNPQTVTVAENTTVNVAFAVLETTGTLTLTVTGLGPAASHAGSAEVTRTDITGQTPQTVDIPLAGSVDRVLVTGSYSVVHSPPPDHEHDTGQSNTQNVTITTDQTSGATFAVVESTGTLHFAITGLEAGVPNGGSASVIRTGVPGQTPVVVNIPASGIADIERVVGTHTVTYTAPDGYQVSAGQVNPRNVTITNDATTDFILAVSTAVAPVFHSDWSTALGTGQIALRDTGKAVPWSSATGPVLPQLGDEVVDSTGLDFPSTNVYLARGEFQGGGQQLRTRIVRLLAGTIPVPAIGGKLFYRWYWRNVCPDALDCKTGSTPHAVQDGTTGSTTNWQFEQEISQDGTYLAGFHFNSNPFPNTQWRPTTSFNKNQTYRWELHIERIGTTTFNAHVRVYNSAGTLLLSDADFKNINGSANLSNTPTLTIHALDSFGLFQAGQNGSNWLNITEGQMPFLEFYEGCVAIRTGDWCGPYSGGV